jgi:hypothetical protein
MRGTLWALAKGFIPVFRFFEAGTILPVLEVRAEDSETAWFPHFKRSPVRLSSLFHNPDHNLNLYLYSMIHELTQDHLDRKSDSFAQKKLVETLYFHYPKFQYRIRNALTKEVILTSDWYNA